jgi:hypothetical protein
MELIKTSLKLQLVKNSRNVKDLITLDKNEFLKTKKLKKG